VPSTQLLSALDDFAKAARRIPALNQEQEEQIQQIRTSLVNWVTEKKDVLTNIEELKNANEIQLLKKDT
jgi:chaperonin cofactor prefoldin